ncbi:MAG TPA: MFS transporter [Acidimicrobiia bacterium]|nr:MFS transporter [Acidimicrobiia bacterium]
MGIFGLSRGGRHRDRLGPRFKALFWGQAISQVGDYIAYITVPLFVVSISESTLSLGLTYALETVPGLLLGLVGGVLLDRLPLRSVLVVADIARAVAFFALGFVALNPNPSTLLLVFLLSFIIGSFSSVFQNGLYALVPSLVRSNQITVANSRIATSQQFALVVGPFLAGWLASFFGVAPGFFINGLTFLASAVSIVLVGRVPVRLEGGDRSSFAAEAWHGLRFLWNEPRLRASTIAAATANAAVGFLESTLVIIGTDLLGASESQLGILFMTLGFGGIVGALFAPFLVRHFGLGRVLTGGLFVFGVMFLLAVRSTYGFVAISIFFAMFVGLSLVNVPLATIRQTYTPGPMLGRVISAARTIGWSTLPVGALLGTALADNTSYRQVAELAPLLLVITAIGLLFTPIWSQTFGERASRRITSENAKTT